METTKLRIFYKYILLALLFLALFLGMRWFWYNLFATADHPPAEQGILDMRGLDLDEKPIFLSGEWEFYPDQLLTREEMDASDSTPPVFLKVPGDWRGAWDEANNSYGYGTYRLRILVDQPLDEPYALLFPSIQASSAVEVNGRLAAEEGQPAEEAASYTPGSRSYMVSYIAESDEPHIELLVQVANFDHPYKGGITRPIRFGSQAAIDYTWWYSIGFQLVTFIILILHGLYSLLLYLFSRKEKVFLIFFLLLFTAGMTIITDHDFLIRQWVYLNYEWTTKLRILSYVWITFLILLMSRAFSGIKSGKKLFYGFLAVLVAYTLFTLAAPVSWVFFLSKIRLFAVLYFFPLIWFFYIIVKMLRTNRRDAMFLLFSGASVTSSAIWGIFSNRGFFNDVYYPIDILAALVGFSAYWFRRYFRNAEENARLTERLKEQDKQKDIFLANTSHELRTPLHGIMNIASSVTAKEKHVMAKKSVEDMELLITISRRMSYLLDDLLDVVQLKDKRIVLKMEPLSVSSTVSGVADMLRYMAEGKALELKVELGQELPLVQADEKRLVQILFNLVHNAVKYTESGTITISAAEENGQVTIKVADTGIGMDEETKIRAFLPYEQGIPANKTDGGIGLGLSISQQLVKLHGSELQVESEPGRGSVFSFSLTAIPESEAADQSHAAKANRALLKLQLDKQQDELEMIQPFQPPSLQVLTPLSSSTPLVAKGTVHILAVDDDPVNLKVLTSILEKDEFHIETASSGVEALERLNERPWDLLIVDVMMPYMSGYDFTKRVREEFSISELPVLLLTARSQPQDIYTGFLSGANDYVTKPVDALELQYRVGALVTLKQSVKERLRMEAAYLQAQIHPHFLFNTLNSIIALSEIDIERMNRLGEAFASYLKISFDFLNSGEQVELYHELNLVHAYLYIEKERFGDRLKVNWAVDDNLNILIPPLTLQPLVENAARHGALSQIGGGTISIRIARQEDGILFEVSDDGVGMEVETIERLLNAPRQGQRGIGIFNTNRRLIQMYGRGLEIRSQPGNGTTVSFKIPVRASL
ncbi:hybrid sensor histidine kinase/response regulator [Paenibacillus senegalensis]|uniref:hybrid sensor histidine kinase/response regulator n=1 Tax=Paenibacillus senegalensis TaxID=1465766 RepID=UPI0011DD2260|nr:ATP-binding protein [Paenibacillus senegalensis]